MSEKVIRVENIVSMLKVGAWTALTLIILAVLSTPIVMISAMFEPGWMYYLWLVVFFGSIGYLSLFLWGWLLSKVNPKGFRIAVAILSIALVISCGFLVHSMRQSRAISTLDSTWNLNLPSDARLIYRRHHSVGFTDWTHMSYYVFVPNSPWENSSRFLTNSFGQVWQVENLRQKFPGLPDRMLFQLFFEQEMRQNGFDIPYRYLPDWDCPALQWGLSGGCAHHFEPLLFVVYTGRLTFFEISYS